MVFIPKLSEYCLSSLVRKFEELIDNMNFLFMLSKTELPLLVGNQLFERLNQYHTGLLPDNILNIFKSGLIKINDLSMSVKKMHYQELREFLSEKKWKKLKLDGGSCILKLNGLIDKLDKDMLSELSLTNFRFETNSKYTIKSFKNIMKLDISDTNINNFLLFQLLKGMYSVEDLNISGTEVTDFRLLKNCTNLQYLDCSRLNEECIKYFPGLQILRKLKYFRFSYYSNENKSTICNSKKYSNIKHFLTNEELKEYNDISIEFHPIELNDFSLMLELIFFENLIFFDLQQKTVELILEKSIRYLKTSIFTIYIL